MKSAAKCVLLAAFCLAALALVPLNSCAQEEQSSTDVIKINTDLVVLDAQVINKKTGQTVDDLRREDFELYEDGIKQEISYFSQDELPLSILLLLDTSGSVRPIIEQIGEGALSALQQLKPQDEVAVMAFATYPQLIQRFTNDRQLITDKIKEASRTFVGNGTFLNDALMDAADVMSDAANPSSRRVVIVITDNLAKTGNKREVARTMRELFESGSVVYGLIVRSGFGKAANILTLGLVKAVNSYSEQTGGEVIHADKKEVEAKLTETIRHLRIRYSLGFKPSDTRDEQTFRRLRLQLLPATAKRRKDLAVRTKQGYYFQRRN
jgi:VWFA-related protein